MAQPHNSRRSTPKKPLALSLIQTGLRWLSFVAPDLTARLAYRLWFYPRRHQEPVREQKWRATAEHFFVNHRPDRLALSRWGEGPIVMLVHGWDGRGAQLGAFVHPLVDSGYQVIALDLPAHGRSTGKKTNMLEASVAINGVTTTLGSLHAVIAHSFGAGALARALNNGLDTKKAVLISPPANLRWMADSFFQALGLNPEIQLRIENLVTQEFGASIWQDISADYNLNGLTTPGFIVHDAEDRDVPFSQTELLMKVWPNAELLRTTGLGHRRILRDKQVVQRVVEFIADPLST